MKKRTRKISVRLTQDNFDILCDLADGLWKGNLSDTLDHIISTYASNNFGARLLRLLHCLAEWNRGVRTREVCDGKRELEALLIAMTRRDEDTPPE